MSQIPSYPEYHGAELLPGPVSRQPAHFWQTPFAPRIFVRYTLSPQPNQAPVIGLAAPSVPRDGVTPGTSAFALDGSTPGLPGQPVAPRSYQGLRAPRWQEAVFGLDATGAAL